MTEKYVLVEHSSSINNIIQSIFETTQRIKFTAFDVSQKYIIFGVNSGGIYIFHREPCQFFKLIPNTHGPASLILISEKEENLAVAFTSGTLIVLENCFSEFNLPPQIFTEHENSTITALKWNSNDLFCGDSLGKVTVITIKNFLTKAIFQPPIAVLMTLESKIVQIDTFSRFLLISTMTRSILCDTETERYRQIGKKLRDGHFGACFYEVTSNSSPDQTPPIIHGSFHAIPENEPFLNGENGSNLKIFCARPGARLWQVDGQTNVICTHQLRDSLAIKQTDLFHFESGDDELRITRFSEGETVSDFSFGAIYCLKNYLLAFNADFFYIFEPFLSRLVYWSGAFSKIKDIKILNFTLYIWHSNFDVSIISLQTIEEIILKNLLWKKYRVCGKLCVEFRDDLNEIVKKSRKIHLISVLEPKLAELGYVDLGEKLKSLFQMLRDLWSKPTLEKLNTGIVTVNNVYTESVETLNNLIPETVEQFEFVRTETDIVAEQYKINRIHKEIETREFENLIKGRSCNEIYKLLQVFMEKEPNSIIWCGEVILKCLLTREICQESFNLAKTTFLNLNTTQNCCQCKFPLPCVKKSFPKYYKSGVKLFELLTEKLSEKEEFLERVPYMYRFVLEKLNNSDEIKANLALLIQYSDGDIFKKLSNKFTYDIWDEGLQLLFNLRKGVCLNCPKKISNLEGVMDIKSFALLIVQSINAKNAIKLLKRYATNLENGELDERFYQFCIFSTVANVELNGLENVLRQKNVAVQFNQSMEAFLGKRYLKKDEIDCESIPKTKKPFKCDFCQMPLEIPILHQAKLLTCGHHYHAVCWIYQENKCFVCFPSDV